MPDELFVKLILNIIVPHKNVSNFGLTLFTKLFITSGTGSNPVFI